MEISRQIKENDSQFNFHDNLIHIYQINNTIKIILKYGNNNESYDILAEGKALRALKGTTKCHQSGRELPTNNPKDFNAFDSNIHDAFWKLKPSTNIGNKSFNSPEMKEIQDTKYNIQMQLAHNKNSFGKLDKQPYSFYGQQDSISSIQQDQIPRKVLLYNGYSVDQQQEISKKIMNLFQSESIQLTEQDQLFSIANEQFCMYLRSIQISNNIYNLLVECNNSPLQTDKIVIKYIGIDPIVQSNFNMDIASNYLIAYSHIQPILQFIQETDNLKIKEIVLLYTNVSGNKETKGYSSNQIDSMNTNFNDIFKTFQGTISNYLSKQSNESELVVTKDRNFDIQHEIHNQSTNIMLYLYNDQSEYGLQEFNLDLFNQKRMQLFQFLLPTNHLNKQDIPIFQSIYGLLAHISNDNWVYDMYQQLKNRENVPLIEQYQIDIKETPKPNHTLTQKLKDQTQINLNRNRVRLYLQMREIIRNIQTKDSFMICSYDNDKKERLLILLQAIDEYLKQSDDTEYIFYTDEIIKKIRILNIA